MLIPETLLLILAATTGFWTLILPNPVPRLDVDMPLETMSWQRSLPSLNEPSEAGTMLRQALVLSRAQKPEMLIGERLLLKHVERMKDWPLSRAGCLQSLAEQAEHGKMSLNVLQMGPAQEADSQMPDWQRPTYATEPLLMDY